MSKFRFKSLRSFAEESGFELEEPNEDAFSIQFYRNNLKFCVTVAHSVLEWFIDIEDITNGFKFQDWCDYVGYDKTPKETLAIEMENDLIRLFESLISREFRLSKGKTPFRPSDNCEWLVNDKWKKFDYGKT